MNRPTFVQIGSYTANLMDKMEAAASSGDRRVVENCYLELMSRVDGITSSKIAADESNQFADYLEQFDEMLVG